MNEVPLARPTWNEEEYFEKQFEDVTILICQRKTRDLIQLCVSSILQHYPEVKILIVDGHSEDDSVEWLRFMATKHKNITLWERPEGRNSHGETMHEAVTQFITTKYFITMDSDTVMRRGGVIEGLQREIRGLVECFAVGSLMYVTRSGEACGAPKNESDRLAYSHPSFSMFDREIYLKLNAPFHDHGAPCVASMIEAEKQHYEVKYFPVDKYVQHLCGASWQDIPTVWNDDADIQVRPLVTFICDNDESETDIINEQTDHDFNMIMVGKRTHQKVSTYDRGQLIGNELLYDSRFKVNGYYVCDVRGDINIPSDFVKQVRDFATQYPLIANFELGKAMVVERKIWQKYITIK